LDNILAYFNKSSKEHLNKFEEAPSGTQKILSGNRLRRLNMVVVLGEPEVGVTRALATASDLAVAVFSVD